MTRYISALVFLSLLAVPHSVRADLSGADLSGADGSGAADASGERAEPPCDDCNGCTCRLPAGPGAPREALPLLSILGLALLRLRCRTP